jgi:GTP diphosphokinase / guanosine-3',5'-bis(diphosphate) 3'-diphosphatase
MLERIKAILAQYSSQAAFSALVEERFAENKRGRAFILRALRIAAKEHEGSYRLDGRPVLVQPLAVAVLLMEYAQSRDTKLIAAALLHLFIEEVEGWNFHRLHRCFGYKVAQHVDFVSKEPGEDDRHWRVRTRLSHQKLRHAPASTQTLKLFDRFNNLLSIGYLPKWKQKRMLADTVEFYIPRSRKLGIFQEELLEAVKCASRVNAS